MRVLITGATGQLARSLLERCSARANVELVALGRPDLDVELPETIARAFQQARPDLVINTAAYTAVDVAEDEPERAFAINSAGAGEVARIARRFGAALIHISTDYVFNGRSEEPYSEHSPTDPLNVYGQSKLEGEDRVRAGNPDHVIVRTAWLYSPFGSNFVKTMLRLAAERDEIAVVADQRGSPTSALELADALLVMAEEIGRGRRDLLGCTLHVAGPEALSWADFAEIIFAVSAAGGGPSASVRRIATSDFPTRAARPHNSVLSSHAFERKLGLSLPNQRSSAAEVVARVLSSRESVN